MSNIVTNNIFLYLEQQKEIDSFAVWMLNPEIIHMPVWGHTKLVRGNPVQELGGSAETMEAKEQHPPCKNERLED